MQQHQLVSIIVPVFNTEKYLHECIDSILMQSYINLEVILVNDGATDNSPQICDEYAVKDSRVKVIHMPKIGVSQARNTGIDAASGDFLSFVDSDDWIDPDMIEFLYNNLIAYDVDISHCGFYRSYVNADVPQTKKYSTEPQILTNEQAVEKTLAYKLGAHPVMKLYKKHIFDNIRFPDKKLWVDAAIIIDVLMSANKIYTHLIPKYHYRQRKTSITYNQSRLSRLMMILDVVEERQNKVDSCYPQFSSLHESGLYSKYMSAIDLILSDQHYKKDTENYTILTQILNKLKNRQTLLQNECLSKKDKLYLYLLKINARMFIRYKLLKKKKYSYYKLFMNKSNNPIIKGPEDKKVLFD